MSTAAVHLIKSARLIPHRSIEPKQKQMKLNSDNVKEVEGHVFLIKLQQMATEAKDGELF